MKQKLLLQDNTGYAVQQTPAGANVWHNSTGLCWRTGYWTPAMANKECDSDLLPKEEPKPVAEAPAPTPAPAVVPAPAPAPEVVKITLASTALFDFNKSTLRPGG